LLVDEESVRLPRFIGEDLAARRLPLIDGNALDAVRERDAEEVRDELAESGSW
jgi:hypothetical protein